MNNFVPILVAHRGYPSAFPENSLAGISAALDAGTCFVEFDIQLGADKVPVLLHDKSLLRTTGVDKSVFDCTLAELRTYTAGEPARFGTRYQDIRIPSLAEAVELFKQWPEAGIFVEIKRDSLRYHGHRVVLDAVIEAIEPIRAQCIIISFDYQFVEALKHRNMLQTGWAIKSINRRTYKQAVELAPDFLFFSTRLLSSSPEPLWSGPWQWVIYTVNEPESALAAGRRGISFVETDSIGEMLKNEVLKQKQCRHDR